MQKTMADILSDNREEALEWLQEKGSRLNYCEMVEFLVKLQAEHSTNSYEVMDATRITEINHGDYQGTLIYVVGAQGYQPSTYWYTRVYYGSCSGCDALEGAYGNIEELYSLLQHIASEFRMMYSGKDEVA